MSNLYTIIQVTNTLFVVVNSIDPDEVLGEYKTRGEAEARVEELEAR